MPSRGASNDLDVKDLIGNPPQETVSETKSPKEKEGTMPVSKTKKTTSVSTAGKAVKTAKPKKEETKIENILDEVESLPEMNFSAQDMQDDGEAMMSGQVPASMQDTVAQTDSAFDSASDAPSQPRRSMFSVLPFDEEKDIQSASQPSTQTSQGGQTPQAQTQQNQQNQPSQGQFRGGNTRGGYRTQSYRGRGQGGGRSQSGYQQSGGYQQGGYQQGGHQQGNYQQGGNYQSGGYQSQAGGGYQQAGNYQQNGGYQNGYNQTADLNDPNVQTEDVKGVLDTSPEGHGLLRPNFAPSRKDVYISTSQIRRFWLRPGDVVEGPARIPKENERYMGLLKVERVNGHPVEEIEHRVRFDDLMPVYPDEQLTLETGKDVLSTRMIDLVAPIGKGQRGMIVSPPKAGKTTIMKEIATGIARNYKDVHLMAVLIGERPEEVTDIRRHIETITDKKGEVAASNFDEPAEQQTRIAEIALERAKRLVESGMDVVILLDSITRLARAYNLAIPTSGRTLSGGFDPAALYPPKRFFGAARNVEHGGSLTILGTALVETGSRMDDLVYEEFKGTGNMELVLDRSLAERRIFPSIDVQRSGTRKEELLFKDDVYQSIVTMRRMIDVLGKDEQAMLFIDRLRKTKSNAEFLAGLKQG